MAEHYRYHLVASFDSMSRTPKVDLDQHTSTVFCLVPFVDPAGKLNFGIQSMVDSLRKIRVYPSESGFDAIVLAMMVHIADMKVSRAKQSQDSWTREIALTVPVHDGQWESHRETIERMLRFLTGDIWRIEFGSRVFPLSVPDAERTGRYEVASLFSGGMDSLIAAIDRLESGEPTLLVSHAGESLVRNFQLGILSELDRRYEGVPHENAYLWTQLKDIELPFTDKELSQRSRSFLFIAVGLFAMSGTRCCSRLHVPENGLIALNVPLDATRIGSHSTRTTHPFYLQLWNQVAGDMFGFSIENPYWKLTKGEMALGCLNREALMSMLGKSCSCSSVNSARIRGGVSQHCGHCLPCIIRRSAIHKAFGPDDPTKYLYKKVCEIRDNRDSVGEHLRSFEYAISRLESYPNAKTFLVHIPGPLPADEEYLSALGEMYWRGMMEVADWLEDSLENEDAR